MSAHLPIDASWLAEHSDTEEAATILAELVAIRSLPGEEAAVQAHVAAWLTAQGLPVEFQETEPDRPNVICTIRNGEGPVLLINGHTDTASVASDWIPGRILGQREGDRFIGLGAADMKSGVVAAMLATRALDRARNAWRGTVIFASVVDEEAYSIGARALIANGLAADFCVVTESSWAKPCLGSFGKMLIRVDITGRGAHASLPHLGINAAVEASRFVAQLDDVPLRNHPRITPVQSVLQFHSGPTVYESIVVPDKARVLINWHTVPGETAEDVIERLQDLVRSIDSPAKFEFSIDPPYYPAWETPVDAPLVSVFGDAYAAEAGKLPEYGYTGYGDMNLFSSDAGIPTVMFGPLGGNYHEAEEWVDLPSIGATTRVLLRMTCALLPA